MTSEKTTENSVTDGSEQDLSYLTSEEESEELSDQDLEDIAGGGIPFTP